MHNFAPKPLSLLISQVDPWPFSHTGMTTGAEISWVEQNGGGEEKTSGPLKSMLEAGR